MAIDASEVTALAADLKLAPNRMHHKARGISARGALEIKRSMQRLFSGHRYGGKLPASLEYERVEAGGGQYVYDIGELDSAGPSWGIAAIMACGTSNNAPNVDFTRAASREGLVIQERLGDAGEDAVLGGAH